MSGSLFITGHDVRQHAFGQTRQVECVEVPEGKEKDGLGYWLGETYVAQSCAPGSDNWDAWVVALSQEGDMLSGFVFSKKDLRTHFAFID